MLKELNPQRVYSLSYCDPGNLQPSDFPNSSLLCRLCTPQFPHLQMERSFSYEIKVKTEICFLSWKEVHPTGDLKYRTELKEDTGMSEWKVKEREIVVWKPYLVWYLFEILHNKQKVFCSTIMVNHANHANIKL